MRIIGGKLRSRKLVFPKTKLTRPLTDRAKETIFNILGDRSAVASVLDLFAGSGSFGVEALSRGAQFVTFVDHAEICRLTIRKNLEALGLLDQALIARKEALGALREFEKQGKKFDLIFLDPPHNKGLIKKTLRLLDHFDIVRPSGVMVIGHSDKETLPEQFETFRHERSVKIGQSYVSFIIQNG